MDVTENKLCIVVTKLSSKFFLFFQIWHQPYLYFQQDFAMIWNSKQFSSLVKRLLQAFLDSPNWIYKNIYIYIYIKAHKKHCKGFEHVLCFFSSNIFDGGWVWYIFKVDQFKQVIYVGLFTFNLWMVGGTSCRR